MKAQKNSVSPPGSQSESSRLLPLPPPPLSALLWGGDALGGLGGSSGLWAEVQRAEILGGGTRDFERARSFRQAQTPPLRGQAGRQVGGVASPLILQPALSPCTCHQALLPPQG